MHPTERALWIDLETTGSNVMTDPIIEIGWAVTSGASTDFEILASGECVVSPLSWPATMDLEVVRMHTLNGLLDAVICGGEENPSIHEADALIFQLVKPWATRGKIRFAGSGVAHFDAKYIERYMPQLWKLLHYAPLDIGHVRRFLTTAGVTLPTYTSKSHRALRDVMDHIEEARALLQMVREGFA